MDGTSQVIQITEISQLTRLIAYSVISSEPSVTYSSANHEISLMEVTTSNQTFIEWSTNFSNDASIEVIEDSRFKKKEGFKDLKKHLSVNATVNNESEDDLEVKEETIIAQDDEQEEATETNDEIYNEVYDEIYEEPSGRSKRFTAVFQLFQHLDEAEEYVSDKEDDVNQSVEDEIEMKEESATNIEGATPSAAFVSYVNTIYIYYLLMITIT